MRLLFREGIKMKNVICLNTYRDSKEIKYIPWPKDTSEKPYTELKGRIEARFGDTLPKHFKTLMAKPQSQPYMCGDVSSVKYRDKQKNFNAPMPVPCEVTIESCARDANGILTLGGKCVEGIDEAFGWIDLKYQVTLNFLRSLPDGTEINIQTRSDLVAQELYVAELNRLKATVHILFTSNDEQWHRTNEPGAPSLQRRQEAIKVLKEFNIQSSMAMHLAKKAS